MLVLLRTTLLFLVLGTPTSRAFLFNLFPNLRRRGSPGRVTGMQLVRAPSGTVVTTNLVNGTIVYLGTIAAPQTLTVVAVTDTTSKRRISTLVFDWNAKLRYRTETTAPYTLCGGNSYAVCTDLRAGVHTVTATPNGGASFRVTFTLVDGTPPLAPIMAPPVGTDPQPAPVKAPPTRSPTKAAPVQAIVPTRAPASIVAPTPPPTQPAIFINCGGGSYIDPDRIKWDADVYFGNGGGTIVTVPIVDIGNTAKDELYLSHREVLNNTTPNFIRYDIPVVNGLYEIQLHFAETRYVATKMVSKSLWTLRVSLSLTLDYYSIHAAIRKSDNASLTLCWKQPWWRILMCWRVRAAWVEWPSLWRRRPWSMTVP
jgi:Malectin domain